MPKVSIIIPVYNKEQYISDTLDSVFAQSFSDFEVIIINDGSTDNSEEILLDYKRRKPDLKLITIPNGGVSHARNTGLMNSKGEWIQFLDADDLIEENYLEDVLKKDYALKADIIFTDFQMGREKGEVFRRICSSHYGWLSQDQLCDLFIQLQYENGFFGFISNKLFKRSLWVASRAKFPEGTTLAEDLDFFVRLYPYVKNAYISSRISFLYRQTLDNYTQNLCINYYEQLQIQLDVRNWFEETGALGKHRGFLDKKISDYAYFVLFHGYEEEKTIPDTYEIMINNKKIMSCIHPELTAGFEAVLLRQLVKHKKRTLLLLLAGRYTLRQIYRSVHER